MTAADTAVASLGPDTVVVRPDPSRVYAALFMPGEEMPGDHSRAIAVMKRVLALDGPDVTSALAELHARFADRPWLDEVFQRHFDAVSPRLDAGELPSADRRLLIGAYFTHDVSPEGAALTNPSMVAHPDQAGVAEGGLRFILSARAIGEGHVSSAEFRTGTISGDGDVELDPAGPHLEPPCRVTAEHERDAFWGRLRDVGYSSEAAHLVLDRLGATFDRAELEDAISRLDFHLLTRQTSQDTINQIRQIADNNYTVAFPHASAVSERILVPTGPTESNGIEDARWVRFVDDDGRTSYRATYTAYDGRHISPQLLRTDDFVTFSAHQLSGPAAKNKGMALFPRKIDGRYVSLSRWDRESSFVAWSDDGLTWGSTTRIEAPRRAWDLIQVGNCGSPLETADGWLVLTHGVGPMRTYTIGAMLLDLEDPRRVLAALPTPLVGPTEQQRSGYVPNVAYTCGGLVHGELLVLPYGVGDQTITITVIDLPGLMTRLHDAAPLATH
ncbi:MAG: glycoside hydrolase family 130 protein [Acidimicrobiales bacterium]